MLRLREWKAMIIIILLFLAIVVISATALVIDFLYKTKTYPFGPER